MRKLALVAGVVALAAVGCNDQKKIEDARKEISLLAKVLMSKNTVPKDQADFVELTRVAGSADDPWGARYRYRRDENGIRKIRIYSLGPDGKDATADDVAEEYTFPTGTGLEEYLVQRADGVKAIRSPDGTRTFWTTERMVGTDQIVDYWVGDAAAGAEKPIRSQTVDTNDFRRGVTLVRWSRDSRFVTIREIDGATRPDNETEQRDVTIDATTGEEVGADALPAELAWLEY